MLLSGKTQEFDVKIVLLGSTFVGKTSLTMRYCHNRFNTPVAATIGASFLQKKVKMPNTNTVFTFQIWDTAGQERFRSMAPMYYRNAKAAILVFDITNEKSFVHLTEWLNYLRRHVRDDIVLAVVANKIDTSFDEQMDLSLGKKFAEEIGASWHETSAKQGTGVNELFEIVAQGLYHQLLQDCKNKEQGSGFENALRSGSLADGGFSVDYDQDDEHIQQPRKCC